MPEAITWRSIWFISGRAGWPITWVGDAFSNGGYLTKAYGVQRIRTAKGQVLYDHDVSLPPRTAVIGQPALA